MIINLPLSIIDSTVEDKLREIFPEKNIMYMGAAFHRDSRSWVKQFAIDEITDEEKMLMMVHLLPEGTVSFQ